MDEENRKDKSNSSLRSDLDDLRGQLRGELDRLRNIIVSAEDDDFDEVPDENSAEKLTNTDEQELNQESSLGDDINDGIQEELTWKTAEIFFRILKKPDNKNKYLSLFDSFLDKENNELIGTIFEGEDISSEFFGQISPIINQFKEQYITNMRDEAFKFAQNIYSPEEFYLSTFEPIRNLEIQQITQEIDKLFSNSTNIFTLRKNFLAKLEERAKVTGKEVSMNDIYEILRETFPSQEEYRLFIVNGWKMSAHLASILTELLAEEEASKKIYKLLFDKILDINKTIVDQFIENEISKIY